MRKAIFWFHLFCGVVAGAIVLLMSVTGVLLTYERQMLARADRAAYRVQADSAGRSLERALAGKEALLAKGTVVVRSAVEEPLEIQRGREGSTYLHPATGEILGESKPGPTHGFFASMRAWHRWLGATDGPGRQTGKAITGACNLAFLGIVLTGAYLWLPRIWRWPAVRQVLWFRGGLSGKARDFNWHNAIGIWCFVPLAVVVAGAVPISYTWASDWIYSTWGGAPTQPPAIQQQQQHAPRQVRKSETINVQGLDALLARAQRQAPEWQTISFRAAAPLVFNIDEGTGGQPQKKHTLTLDRASGEVLKWEPFGSLPPGRRIRMWLRFLHTGEALGIMGQTIAGIASLGAVVLVWTGIALSLRRWRSWRARNATRTPAEQAATAVR